MKNLVPARAHRSLALLLAALLVGTASQAVAFNGTLNDWQARYGASSPSGDNARCQLCHGNANGGSPWNGYGWDLRDALADPLCDSNGNGTVSNEEAFFCVELMNSDLDGSNNDNLLEIGLGTQPGWTAGAFNTLYSQAGTIDNQLPPDDIGPLDPDGTEPPPPPPPPPPPDDEEEPERGQGKRRTIVVKPGQSIQAALDRARPYTRILIQPGEYRELSSQTNALNITKSGISLIGQGGRGRGRVVLKNAGNQRNGIAVVPPAVTECMDCHASMEPPFELLPHVEPGMPDPTPLLYDIEIRNIDIEGFVNNGLFTERVDGFEFIDVRSIDNKNYGIFPILSKNGLIADSYASGSDDSGIWVETSENVVVTRSLTEGNVNGFEVSNSDDILLIDNEARNNSVGMAILLLPDIFDDRPGAKRIDMKNNWIHDNNKPNTARPGSILASVPSGTGILHVGVDDSEISGNLIEGHNFLGVGLVDYCAVVFGTDFSCDLDPTVTVEFIGDSIAQGNRVVGNTVIDNATNPDPSDPFAFAASDMGLLSLGLGNCFADNIFGTFYSAFGPPVPPECPE